MSATEIVQLPEEWAGGQVWRNQTVLARFPDGTPRVIQVTFEVDSGEMEE